MWVISKFSLNLLKVKFGWWKFLLKLILICFFVKVYWLIEMKIESNGGLKEDLFLLLNLVLKRAERFTGVTRTVFHSENFAWKLALNTWKGLLELQEQHLSTELILFSNLASRILGVCWSCKNNIPFRKLCIKFGLFWGLLLCC